tara:strand:- start:5256 stop:6473 length:1218 start_codon:yes stop_codon:yes gene_type:complete
MSSSSTSEQPDFHLGNTSAISLYVHIPFCKTKCGYCDFNTYQGMEDLMPSYVNAVCEDIKNWLCSLNSPRINTIFFGGGTPSLMTKSQIQQIMDQIRLYGNILQDAEITLESNPDDLDESKCIDLYESGINRLSIGVQALQPKLLTLLNRRHSDAQALQAISNGRLAGFTNISGDLMYGLPNQTQTNWETTVTKLVNSNPDHISMYSLTIEEGTPFYKMFEAGKLKLPTDDQIADMYSWAQSFLDAKGYHQYEISNWCKQDRKSLHNLAYWTRYPYIGIGPGAHSNLGNVRYWNIKSPSKYIETVSGSIIPNEPLDQILENPIVDGYEVLSNNQIASELVFLGLRLADGINCAQYHNRYDIDIKSTFKEEFQKLEQEQLIEIDGDTIKLPRSKVFIANRIFEEFI